jgi:hypothetical protein
MSGLRNVNQGLAQEIRAELCQGNKKSFSIPGSPSEYFNQSSFWDYAPAGAMSDWHYCLSRLLSKETIIPGVFIGTEKYALLTELLNGDYELKSNEFYLKNDPSFHLVSKSEEAEQTWTHMQVKVLGSQQEKIRFTRVISVVKHGDDEALLRKKLHAFTPGCGYGAIKTHEIIQLRDLPQNALEKQDQQAQWRALEDRFEDLFTIIDQAREEQEPILIHCMAGRHRSVAVVAAYLIDRLGLSAKEALDYIRTKRGCAVHYERSEFSLMLSSREKNDV